MMSWVKKRDVRFIKCPHTPSHMVMEGEGMPRRRSNRVTGWGGVLVLVLALSYNVKISRDDNFSKKVLNFFQDDSPPNYTLSRRTQQLLVFLSVPWCSQQLLFELNIIYPLLISFFYCWGWVNEVIFCSYDEGLNRQGRKEKTGKESFHSRINGTAEIYDRTNKGKPLAFQVIVNPKIITSFSFQMDHIHNKE